MEEFFRQLAIAASQISVSAERIWPQIVMITFVKSLISLVVWLVLSVVFSVATFDVVKTTFRKQREYKEQQQVFNSRSLSERYKGPYPEEPGGWYVASFVVGIVLFFVLLGTLAELPQNVTGVLYPEARTVLDITNKLVK